MDVYSIRSRVTVGWSGVLETQTPIEGWWLFLRFFLVAPQQPCVDAWYVMLDTLQG